MRPHELDLEGLPAEFQRPRTALIPMLTGFLSILGSYLVIREVWVDRRMGASAAVSSRNNRRMRAPLARTLLAISVMDLLFSIAIACSTLPTPHWQTHVPYAMGNNATCETQGFFLQFGNMTVLLYFVLLAFLYLVILRYQWTDVHIQKVEIWAHSLILIVSLACSIFPIPMEMYNNGYHACFLAAYPEGCEGYRPEVPCERGGDAFPFLLFFAFFPLWPAIISITIIMFMVYRQVQKAESSIVQQARGITKSSVPQSEDHNDETEEHMDDASTREVSRSRSQAVREQALLFVLAFLAPRLVAIAAALWLAVSGGSNLVLHVMGFDVFLPMQGVFNALVLLRTRKLETPEGKCTQRVFDTFCSALARIKRKLLHPMFSLIKCTSSSKVDDETPAQVTPSSEDQKSAQEVHQWAHESLFICTNPEFGVETISPSELTGNNTMLQE